MSVEGAEAAARAVGVLLERVHEGARHFYDIFVVERGHGDLFAGAPQLGDLLSLWQACVLLDDTLSGSAMSGGGASGGDGCRDERYNVGDGGGDGGGGGGSGVDVGEDRTSVNNARASMLIECFREGVDRMYTNLIRECSGREVRSP